MAESCFKWAIDENFILSQARATSNFINLQIVQLHILLAVCTFKASSKAEIEWAGYKFFSHLFLRWFLPQFFPHSLTLVRLGSLHNKSLFVMTVNHDQIQLSLDPLFLLSLPSSFFRVGNKHSIYWNRKLLTPVVCFAELVWTFFDKEGRLATLQKSDFQSHFSASKIVQIFTKKNHWRI